MKLRSVIRKLKGFTIIELLVVVIIIGILAAAGMAKYQGIAETARQRTCTSNLGIVENACSVWHTQNQPLSETGVSRVTFDKVGRASKSIATDAPVTYTQSDPMAIQKVVRDENVWVCPRAILEAGGNVADAIASASNYLCGGLNLGGLAPIGNKYHYCYVPPSFTSAIVTTWNNSLYYVAAANETSAGVNLVVCGTYGIYSGCADIAPGYKHATLFK